MKIMVTCYNKNGKTDVSTFKFKAIPGITYKKFSPCTPPPQVDCQISGRRHVGVRCYRLDVTPLKPKQFMQWWQHPAELNVAHAYMMAMLPSIQWWINRPFDTVCVQWPGWQQPLHTSKIMIHPRPASNKKLQYTKYSTSLRIVVLKSYSSSINAVADLGLINGFNLQQEQRLFTSQPCPISSVSHPASYFFP
jgi:hypothetical protein